MNERDYEQLTLFPEDSLASRSLLPENEKEPTMTVISGRKCSELYARFSPLGSLAKMLLESSLWHSTRCVLTWKTKVTPSRRLLFRLQASTRRTDVNESQLWATPQARDFRSGQASRWEDQNRSRNLNDQVAMWPTPKASDSKGTGKVGGAAWTRDVEHGNLKAVAFFPTPTTGKLCGGTGGMQKLRQLAEDGTITEEERRNMSQGNGGQLNPEWVEWLMGFPIGWTEV